MVFSKERQHFHGIYQNGAGICWWFPQVYECGFAEKPGTILFCWVFQIDYQVLRPGTLSVVKITEHCLGLAAQADRQVGCFGLPIPLIKIGDKLKLGFIILPQG